MSEQRTLTVGSCFAGIGGIDLGLERTGRFRTVWHSEIDPAALRVLTERFPDAKPVGDIATADPEPVDLLAGGPPCQNISKGNAFERTGLGGQQSGLFFLYAKLLDRLRPRWVVMEQVLGLLTSNGGADFPAVLDAFGGLGYDTAVVAANSLAYVPQSRGRLYFVGCRRPGAAGRALLPLRADGGCDPGAYQPSRWKPAPDPESSPRTFRKSRRPRDNTDGETWVASDYSPTLNRFDIGRPRATVLVVDSTGQARILTPVEWERCHGFPDGWTEAAGSDRNRWNVLGNAVSPPVLTRIGDGIAAVEDAWAATDAAAAGQAPA